MTEQASTDDLVVERTFPAPLAVVWQMWTDPEHFRSWYGPEGAVIPVAEMEVRVGGARRVCMEVRTPQGPMQMWFAGEYTAVSDQALLAYTEAVVDADGAPMPGSAPAPTVVEVAFTAVAGGTRVVLTHHGVPASSPGADGWNMALRKLDTLLAG